MTPNASGDVSADASAELARIARALDRIEAAASRGLTGSGSDTRYERLRTRTQAALAQLDTVIARVGREGAR